MSIETVFLDAGGVLVMPNWDRVSAIFKRHGIQVDATTLRSVEPAARFAIDSAYAAAKTDMDRGGSYFNGVLDRAGVARGAARDAALAEVYAYHMERNLWEDVPEGVVPTLEHLRSMGLTLAVASNANGVLHRCFDRLGLTPFFDVICDSALEGVEKPDRRFFELLLERSGSRRETTVHVGDLYHVDVVGARNAGIRALLLDPLGLYDACDADRISALSQVIDRIESAPPTPSPS
jgi:putative hydrolase of the HAD superfamily